MLNNLVQTPKRKISQKNLHKYGRAELTTSKQRGHHPGSKGCKDQLMISKAIYEDCRRRNKNLSIAQTDYQKAFDNVPHSWVEESIALVGVNSKIVRFCKLSMEWKKIKRYFFFKQSSK